jgi:hypothetical protein
LGDDATVRASGNRLDHRARSGPALASIALDDRWSRLRDGAFVVKDTEREIKSFARDPHREARLWDATAELLRRKP